MKDESRTYPCHASADRTENPKKFLCHATSRGTTRNYREKFREDGRQKSRRVLLARDSRALGHPGLSVDMKVGKSRVASEAGLAKPTSRIDGLQSEISIRFSIQKPVKIGSNFAT